MSFVEPAPHVACPNCGAVLAAHELPAGGKAICANCAHHFLFQPRGDARRMSRKATASLVLGIASLVGFCLTALPALVLGGWALFDIHRSEDRLRGRRLAVTGMALSVLCGFLSLIVWALLLAAIQVLPSRIMQLSSSAVPAIHEASQRWKRFAGVESKPTAVIVDAPLAAQAEDRHDVRVVQLGDRFGLALETPRRLPGGPHMLSRSSV